MPSRAVRRTRMAYREVRMMDIDQVMRRWLAGERIRAVARSTGLDRNTVRRLIRVGQQVGLKLGAAWPDEAKLQSIRERLGRPGAGREQGPIEQALLQRQSQIQAWLKDRLILTKIHELLGREGWLCRIRRCTVLSASIVVLANRPGQSDASKQHRENLSKSTSDSLVC